MQGSGLLLSLQQHGSLLFTSPASYTLYFLAVPDIAVCLCTQLRQVIITADCELGTFEFC